jgi:hypothetical protein
MNWHVWPLKNSLQTDPERRLGASTPRAESCDDSQNFVSLARMKIYSMPDFTVTSQAALFR